MNLTHADFRSGMTSKKEKQISLTANTKFNIITVILIQFLYSALYPFLLLLEAEIKHLGEDLLLLLPEPLSPA